MYKNKYLKYKEKYIFLKKLLITQTGGMTLLPILFQFDKDIFISWYMMKTNIDINQDEGKSSFQVLLDLFNQIPPNEMISIEPYNILVGADCIDDTDYLRFKDSDFYSLYVDTTLSPRIPERQYYMYTVAYDNISFDYRQMIPNSVKNIHFDTGVSYFAPIKYLEIAEYLLIPGGKIVWDLLQHNSNIFMYSNGMIRTYNNIYTEEEIIKQFSNDYHISIDFDEKKIVPIEGFFNNNKINPQIPVKIVYPYEDTFKSFNTEPYNGFLEFCSRTYPRLKFEQKKYSYAKYSYPVPIRIITNELHIHVFNDIVNFVVNFVMNYDERVQYIKSKTITTEQIIELVNRINSSDDLKEKILQKNLITKDLLKICEEIGSNPPKYNLSLILEYLFAHEFTNELEYVEATKI